MTNPNLLPSQRAAPIGILDPDAYAASTISTGWIAMKDFETAQAVIMVGDMVATATVNAKLEQATDGAGAGAKDFSPAKAITELTQAGGDDNKQAIINLRADEFDVNGDFDFFRLTVTIAVAGSDLGALVLGHDPHYGPASDNDLASVDEIVA